MVFRRELSYAAVRKQKMGFIYPGDFLGVSATFLRNIINSLVIQFCLIEIGLLVKVYLASRL